MAIISTLIGGICGFLTFVTAVLFFQVGLLSALALYASVGLGLTTTLILSAMCWQSISKLSTQRMTARPSQMRPPANGVLTKIRN